MVPRLSCPTSPPKGDGYQYDLGGSFWVGINGFPNNNPKTSGNWARRSWFFCSGYNEATGSSKCQLFHVLWTLAFEFYSCSNRWASLSWRHYRSWGWLLRWVLLFYIEDLNIGEGFNSPRRPVRYRPETPLANPAPILTWSISQKTRLPRTWAGRFS